jgi:hypothetical protein
MAFSLAHRGFSWNEYMYKNSDKPRRLSLNDSSYGQANFYKCEHQLYDWYRGIQDLTLAESVQHPEQQLASRYRPFAYDRRWPIASTKSPEGQRKTAFDRHFYALSHGS